MGRERRRRGTRDGTLEVSYRIRNPVYGDADVTFDLSVSLDRVGSATGTAWVEDDWVDLRSSGD